MFRIGQKIVCIGSEGTPGKDWSAWLNYWKIVRPTRGPVYTVRNSRIGPGGRQFIRLVEIVNPVAEFSDAQPQEPWWWASAFRPAVDRKTDISIFTKMLRGSKVPLTIGIRNP